MNAKKGITRRVVAVPKRKHPGGWYYAKKKREAQVTALAKAWRKADFIEKPVIRQLRTLKDCREQLEDVFIRTRLGEMPDHIGSKLTYILAEASKVCKAIEEVEELTALRAQLAAQQNASVGTFQHQTHIAASAEEHESCLNL